MTLFHDGRLASQPDVDVTNGLMELSHSAFDCMVSTYRGAMLDARRLWNADLLESPLHPSIVRKAMTAARDADEVELNLALKRMEKSLDGLEAAELRELCPWAFRPIPPLIIDPSDFED